MVRNLDLFGETEQVRDKPTSKVDPLPVIALAKKKPSKNDTPLEKEIRRFNRIIKELQEYETEAKNNRATEEEYQRLYTIELVPLLNKLALVKFEFAEQLHKLFTTALFKKAEKTAFVDFMINFLEDIDVFVPEANTLLTFYLNMNVQLLSKKEKEMFKYHLEENLGIEDIDIENYDFEELMKKKGKEFLDAEELEEKQVRKKANSKIAPEETELQTVYKELAKLLHPDLEQNDTLKKEKHTLMQELIEARKSQDFFSMLLIKAKAHRLAGINSDNSYSIEKLKLYNKQLKKKLDELKGEFFTKEMNNYFMDSNGFVLRDNKDNPAQKIQQELKAVKTDIETINKDKTYINSPDRLKEFIKVLKFQ